MTATDADRAKAARMLHPFGLPLRITREELEQLDRIAAALASERAAAVADLRARVEALADAVDGGAFGIPPARSGIVARLRDLAAVTDTTGDPA